MTVGGVVGASRVREGKTCIYLDLQIKNNLRSVGHVALGPHCATFHLFDFNPIIVDQRKPFLMRKRWEQGKREREGERR